MEPPVLPYLQCLPPDWDGVSPMGLQAKGMRTHCALPCVRTRGPANPFGKKTSGGGSRGQATGRGAKNGSSRQPSRQRLFCDRNTYFYTGPAGAAASSGLIALRNFSQRNDMSTAQLLLHFFWTYSVNFDFQTQVVAVRSPYKVTKEMKADDGYGLCRSCPGCTCGIRVLVRAFVPGKYSVLKSCGP